MEHALSSCKPRESLIVQNSSLHYSSMLAMAIQKDPKQPKASKEKKKPQKKREALGLENEAVNLFQALIKFEGSVHKEQIIKGQENAGPLQRAL